MNALRETLNKILNVLAGGSLIAITLLTCWQVFTRYILHDPSPWSEELVSYLFAWTSLLGASLVTGERGHMNIPIVIEKLGVGSQKTAAVIAEILAFAFSVIILLYGGVEISKLAMGQMTSSLGVAVGIFYFVMPVCGVINAVYAVLNIAEICRNREEEA